jgi:predicted RNA-binding Zn-ribbon protein involved in translation (DUF1610 family)
MTNKCVSCKKISKDVVKFKCPECGTEICRCQHCRSLDIEYKCPSKECNFKGP